MSAAPDNISEDNDVLLDAYLDGELDAAAAFRVERQMAAAPALKARYERLKALRIALRAYVPRDQPSDELRRRIEALGAANVAAMPPRRVQRLFDWRQMAASVLIAAGVASGATVFALQSPSPTAETSAIVAEHRQMLLAAVPVEVETSDRHTVKPWFDARLALSPQVNDLAADGFALIGGRVDVVGGKLVPAMIYRRHAHLLSLVAVPHSGSRDDGAVPRTASEDGFSVASWRGLDFDYHATADIPQDELSLFVSKWRAASK